MKSTIPLSSHTSDSTLLPLSSDSQGTNLNVSSFMTFNAPHNSHCHMKNLFSDTGLARWVHKARRRKMQQRDSVKIKASKDGGTSSYVSDEPRMGVKATGGVAGKDKQQRSSERSSSSSQTGTQPLKVWSFDPDCLMKVYKSAGITSEHYKCP